MNDDEDPDVREGLKEKFSRRVGSVPGGTEGLYREVLSTANRTLNKDSLVIVRLKNGSFIECAWCGKRIMMFVRTHGRKSDSLIKHYVLRCSCGHEFAVKASVILKTEKQHIEAPIRTHKEKLAQW